MNIDKHSAKTMAWFRMYHEFATDPKVQMLSEADQRRFVMVLCLRCCNGDVTLQDDAVAFQLRVTVEDWQATKARLVARNLIDEDNQPVAWERRQYVSDRSNERVSRHRAAKKAACNVTVTPPETDTESDTDTDANNSPSVFVAARETANGPKPVEEIHGLNGATSEIVSGIAKMFNQLAPDLEWARRQVSSNVAIYGHEAVRDGYAELMADVADNKVRVPSHKALVGYFKTAKDRRDRGAAKPAVGYQPKPGGVLELIQRRERAGAVA